ncbi:protein SFI1 homolog isoform X2 [Vanacampus margaritifer]
MEKQLRIQKRKLQSVRFSVDTKGCAVENSYIPSRVGYSWDKCTRIEELRIRHLARKFLKIWRQKTFGRILPHKAKCHYDSVLLRKTFEGWKEECWESGREWSLSVRAECHYRYHLLYMTFQRWQTFMTLQVEKKSKIQTAQAFADRRRMRQMWDKWKLFIQTRRLKSKTLQLAQEQYGRTSLHSAWRLWQSRLQQHRNLRAMEDQALKHLAIEKESKASLHFNSRVKNKSLHEWQNFVACRQHKEALKAVAKHVARLHLMRVSWSVWRSEWHRQQSKEERLQAAGQLASRVSQRRVLLHWRAYATWRKEKADKGQMANQHHHHRLQFAALQALSLNVSHNRAKRLNTNTAVQHLNQTVLNKHWRLWKERLEEAEDKPLQALTDLALTNYRRYLLSRSFDHWKRKLAQKRRMQELEWRADVWFAEHCLAHYFNSWCEYILRRRVKKDRRHKADVYNNQRLCTWVLYAWRETSNKQKDEMLLLRIAILHEEQSRVQRAWAQWKQRAKQKDDLHCMRWALDRWKKFVQRQKFQRCHEKIVKQGCVARKFQESLKTYAPTERALWHWALTLQAKVLYGWRLWVREQRGKKVEMLEAAQVSQAWKEEVKCVTPEKRKTFNRAQSSLNQVELLQRERLATEKARKHYDSKLLRKALRAWNEHRRTCLKYQVMKRQGILLLRLKMYQTYFALWRRKFLLKVKVCEQTEQALWHWALTLQAKVLYVWRLQVTEQHKKKTEVLEAAQVDKDESQSNTESLLEPGMQRDEEPQSLHIQRLVKRCAMRWKQQALCKPLKTTVTFHHPDLEPESPSDSGEGAADDSELIHPSMRRQPRRCEEVFEPSMKVLPHDGFQTSAGANPQLWQHVSSQTHLAPSSSSLHHPSITFNIAGQSGHVPLVSPQKSPVSILDPPQTSRELLLPPTAFMSTENPFGRGNIFSPTAGPSLEHFSSTPSDINPREPSEESANDTTSSLMRELLNIQQDMRSFQQDRKQLRLWQKVKDALQSWLQTSGKDEEMEDNSVCQQVKELEERIDKLSHELGTRRLTMRFHAERLQHLQAVLDRSGFSSLYRQVQL